MPTLVLVDLHDDHLPEARLSVEHGDYRRALDRCRAALAFARRHAFPVAFVRHTCPPASFLAMPDCPSWINDIRPTRSEMVFERTTPSCYGSSEFAQMAQQNRRLVLAGLFGEGSCLSTLVEGFGRNHHFIFLADASVSRRTAGLSAAETHGAVAAVASRYAEVLPTDAWMERMSRKVGAAG